MTLTYAFVGLVGLYTLAAAAIDIRTHRIPNYLTVPAALAGLAFHALAPNGWGALESLAGFAIGFSLLIVPWLLGGGGMGDVKLLAALGAWLGPKWVLIAFAASIMCAALLAVGVLGTSFFAKGWIRSRKRYLRGPRESGTKVPAQMRVLPFAVPVALTTWAILAWLVSRGSILN